MIFKRFHIVLAIFNFLNFVRTVRILCVYPIPFDSHQSVFHILTEELARLGHELVVLTPLPHAKPLQNVTEINVHNISYSMWEEGFSEMTKHYNSFTMDPVSFWNMVYAIIYPIVDAQFSVPEMRALIEDKTQHFDLILIEACVRPALMINARFEAPVILVSSFYGGADNFYTVGAEINPVFSPDYNIQKIWKQSFWEKLNALYISAKLRLLEWEMEKVENEMIKKHFGNDAPCMQELRNNVKMLFLNVHHVWDNNRPVPPSVVYMGALHLKKPKPLPNDLKKFLDKSQHGVIYMSLGSKIKSSDLPSETIRVIINVFASLPYDVILKWDADEFPEKTKNIRLEKWLPQNDLLHHPKIKAFITQGGLQSTDEAIAANVPLIGLPVIVDQWMNTQKYQQHGIGVQLNINGLTEDDLRRAILDVAKGKSYRDNIRRLSNIMKEQRAGALERAMHWVDYIAKHGTIELHSPSAELNFIEYYMLDIITFIIVVGVVLLALMVIILRSAIKRLNVLLNNQMKLKSH